MEEGSFRCDANVSVRPAGSTALGTKVEIKNMNSFRNVEHAIEYELGRQARAVAAGERLVQETRLWDAEREETRSMRTKEHAHDYRYFPEPDLPPLVVPDEWLEEVRRSLPELPQAKEDRFQSEYGLSKQDAQLLTASRAMADYFERVARESGEPKLSANWILNDLIFLLEKHGKPFGDDPVPAGNLAELVGLVSKGSISGTIAKDVLEEMVLGGRKAGEVIAAKGLEQISDPEKIAAVARGIIAVNSKQVEQYRSGKTATFGWFVGQVMKATRGQANPQVVQEVLKRELGN